MYVSKPIIINSEKSHEKISIHLNKILEKMILKNPEQWIWTHNRWRK
jgi:KDO2-lipid IV(A) lauroyltransferase